jgi:hypothetical protein
MARHVTILALSLGVLLFGCKGCQKDPCDEVYCAAGATCIDGECVPDDQTCDPACEAGEICQGGECVDLDPQCEQAGDECDASLPANEGFMCLDLDGVGPQPGTCMTGCGADGTCDSGALCFFVSTGFDETCETTADCPEGLECSQGSCLDSVCRPSECEGFLDGISTCDDLYGEATGFENGTQCYNVGNSARYCYPAGTKAEGESCTDPVTAITNQQFAETCASGLACVDNVCRVACSGDDQCSGDQECILQSEDLVDPGVGICGDACTPFEVGACDDGFACLPVSADEGVCIEAGDSEAFEECTPGEGDCVDGTICVTYQDQPQVARCQPLCNVTVSDANDNGIVGDFAQQQRDATCPQPERIDAWVLVTSLADLGEAVDVYFGDADDPQVAALAFEGRSDADDQMDGLQWLSLEPGTYEIKVLPGGAPSTDPPLAEANLTLEAEDARQLYIVPVAGASDEVDTRFVEGLRGEDPPTAAMAKVRTLHALVDADALDVIVVPPGDDLSDPMTQTELAADAMDGDISDFVELEAGEHDLLVFPAGDPRTDRQTAVVDTTIDLAEDSTSTLALRGTIDADDTPLAGVTVLSLAEPPAVGSSGATFTCVDTGNGVFGFCQQQCGGGSAGFDGSVCEGGLQCHPTFLQANSRWANLCAPLGDRVLDEPCDPFSEYSECGEGLYCLEYGNTAEDFDPALRGRCTPRCVEDAPDDAILSCADGQECAPISFDPDYVIGECGFPCMPDESYTDTACPAGLRSCKPTASLPDDPANPDRPPTPSVEQSFCSASGDLQVDATCGGNDCTPGSECIFPRSEQTDFVSTLLSPYFGAAGLTPACTPQCDPFDGDSSATTCAADETCLFNFPWSAEVGHCAPVTTELEPLEACDNPGHACGQDSICAINGTQPQCFQFCQYAGPDQAGELQPESCAPGFVCAPLVNDIGVCLSP